MTTWMRRAASVLFVGCLLACSSANADGERCALSEDCESGFCSLAGKCGRGECECEGDECGRVQSSCPSGAVCWRSEDPVESHYPVCRVVCGAEQPCPSGHHCEAGLCAAGPEPVALAWEALPRTCARGAACRFRVRPEGSSPVEKYDWGSRSGDIVLAESTNVPELVQTYLVPGVYDVSVVARAQSGATGRLDASVTVCIPAGGACNANAPCCGTCGRDNTCR